ncbi:MAG: MBL fold metallo-hydrolase [Gordonibacter sp.]|uniref:MBL fold metallo-hydrolase n=1 Tax=Gordonibacter sp. TaxID=1968902 RepID=UPI002FC88C90
MPAPLADGAFEKQDRAVLGEGLCPATVAGGSCCPPKGEHVGAEAARIASGADKATARAPWAGGRISPHVRCVRAHNPSPLTYWGTNTWILSEPGLSDCVVVDPGPLERDHLDAVYAACQADGLRVAAVVLTHDHVDHAEGAEAFASRVGVPVVGRRAGTLPDGPLVFGARGLCLEVVSLPGHSRDSVGLVFPKDESVVTGDFIFRQSSTLICWPDGDLAQYLEGLGFLRDLVRTRGIRRLLTAHGLPIDDPVGAVDRQTAHRRARLEQVRAVIDGGVGCDVDRILEGVYDDVDKRLSPAARVNVQAQLAYLEEEGGLGS